MVPDGVRHSGRDADDRVGFDIHGILPYLKGETSVGDHPGFLHRVRV